MRDSSKPLCSRIWTTLGREGDCWGDGGRGVSEHCSEENVRW